MKAAKPGATYYFTGRLHHIRAILDDDGERIAVVRWWSRRRQMWMYNAEYADLIDLAVYDASKKRAAQRKEVQS